MGHSALGFLPFDFFVIFFICFNSYLKLGCGWGERQGFILFIWGDWVGVEGVMMSWREVLSGFELRCSMMERRG